MVEAEDARTISHFEHGFLQALFASVAQLAMEQGDGERAYEAVRRALDVAKRVASSVLMDRFVTDD